MHWLNSWTLTAGQLTLGLFLGCTSGDDDTPVGGSAAPPMGTAPDVPGVVGPPGILPPTGMLPDGSCVAVTDPGASPLRALTRSEYVRSVRDLTGIDAEAMNLLAPADRSVTTFERTSQNFSLEQRQVRGFLDVAEAAAQRVLGDAASRAQHLGCEPTGANRVACLSSFATTFGRKAFRRPLAAEEVTRLVALAETVAADADPYAGVALMIEGILQSPKFLTHVELGVPGAAGERRALTGFERASRLSYLTLGTTPDDALLTLAETGGLAEPAQVEQLARTLLEDPRVRTNLRGFFQQWLGITRLDDVPKDAAEYPLWDEGLKQSMVEETTLLAEDFAWTGKSFADLLTAKHTFVDARLATLYGLPAPATGFASTPLDGTKRFGLLTQASWLAATAHGAVTPIRRGKFIRDKLLCATPIEVPPGVPELPAAQMAESAREQLERHRAEPQCAGCHQFLDPVGFGLARYDDIGGYREVDANGQAIDESGVLTHDGNRNVTVVPTPDFNGPEELAHKLVETGAFPACAVEKLFEFALARSEPNYCVSEPVKQSFAASGYDFRAAVAALVRSDAFLYRRDPTQQGPKP